MIASSCQSQAIKTPSAIYCSGQIPCDAAGKLIEGTIQDKTGACINNLKVVLEEAGSSLTKVVKVNVFLADMSNFAVSHPRPSEARTKLTEPATLQSMNEEYARWFVHKPARSCVAVKELPKGVEVEIECIALP